MGITVNIIPLKYNGIIFYVVSNNTHIVFFVSFFNEHIRFIGSVWTDI